MSFRTDFGFYKTNLLVPMGEGFAPQKNKRNVFFLEGGSFFKGKKNFEKFPGPSPLGIFEFRVSKKLVFTKNFLGFWEKGWLDAKVFFGKEFFGVGME